MATVGSCGIVRIVLFAISVRNTSFQRKQYAVQDRAARAGYLFALSCLGLIWAGLAAFHTVLNTPVLVLAVLPCPRVGSAPGYIMRLYYSIGTLVPLYLPIVADIVNA